jgi:hypothetical protein
MDRVFPGPNRFETPLIRTWSALSHSKDQLGHASGAVS